jgi:hypothetical protein
MIKWLKSLKKKKRKPMATRNNVVRFNRKANQNRDKRGAYDIDSCNYNRGYHIDVNDPDFW